MTEAQIWTAVLTVVGSTIGAFVAVKLAYGRFRSERLWDARYRLITDILDAVHQIEAAAEHRRATLAHEPTRTDGTGSDGASRAAVRRFTATGGLLLGHEFIDCLLQLDFELFMSDHTLAETTQGEEDPLKVQFERLDHAAQVNKVAANARLELQHIARKTIGAGLPWTARLTRYLRTAYKRFRRRHVDNSNWLSPNNS